MLMLGGRPRTPSFDQPQCCVGSGKVEIEHPTGPDVWIVVSPLSIIVVAESKVVRNVEDISFIFGCEILFDLRPQEFEDVDKVSHCRSSVFDSGRPASVFQNRRLDAAADIAVVRVGNRSLRKMLKPSFG